MSRINIIKAEAERRYPVFDGAASEFVEAAKAGARFADEIKAEDPAPESLAAGSEYVFACEQSRPGFAFGYILAVVG